MTGSIPERIVELANLRELILANNRLSGALPQSFNRGQVQAVAGKAAQEQFFQTLERLDVSINSFSGEIPSGITTLTALRELRLNDNRFSGMLPQRLAALVRLEFFDASRNQLTGTIPENIGFMRLIKQFSVSANRLTGSIPESLGECELIERLDLDSNALEGAMPQRMQFWSSLRRVNLAHNRVTSIPTLAASRTTLDMLHVQGNRLTFESLEGNIGIPNFQYVPQDSVGIAQTLAFRPGSRILLSIRVGGTANVYQWYKNGIPFGAPSASPSLLVTENATVADSGIYECRITNTLVPNLTLISRPWHIIVSSQAPVQVTANPVAQPNIIAPPHAARFVPYAVRLRWTSAEGATSYEVQVATAATFTAPIVNATISTTTHAISGLQPMVRYFWRVRAIGADGTASAWTRAFFTTAGLHERRTIQISSIDFGRVPL
ncbi:MAG: hypothetical protein NZ661_12535, partial [Candidatus Kapabacteria bacterium]|nr:hypothetical protein [Candidatus Kapabacteria bacterium]